MDNILFYLKESLYAFFLKIPDSPPNFIKNLYKPIIISLL